MAKPMSPSKSITKGQIGKFYDVLEAAMLKSGLPSEETQKVLEIQGVEIAEEFVQSVRKRVEAISKLIVRYVKGVNRSQDPQQALDATGRVQYTNKTVADSMPRGEGEEKEVVFFKPRPEAFKNGIISDDDLEKEYEFVGLKPVDPYSLAKVNTDDPAFADAHPNATHWKDTNGKWCYAAF